MNDRLAQELLDKIISQMFGYKNPLSLDQFKSKYAFDVRLPSLVNDSITGQPTWASSTNPLKFITMNNMLERGKVVKSDVFLDDETWMLKKRQINKIEDILEAWEIFNYTATERQVDSLNIYEADNISESENVYHSIDIIKSKNVLFSDGAIGCENIAAVQRSNTVFYSARVEDSTIISDSFSVSWSAKVNKSMFIHDSYDLFECIFCSHIKSRSFCIANMQFEEEEYFRIKDMIIRWVLTGESE